jgi:biotin carboxyl carrier protein
MPVFDITNHARGPNMTIIKAEIPATVWQVRSTVGDEVQAGQELLVLEAMKMEIPVHAPVAGTVTVLHVGPEDKVQEGDHLAELA